MLKKEKVGAWFPALAGGFTVTGTGTESPTVVVGGGGIETYGNPFGAALNINIDQILAFVNFFVFLYCKHFWISKSYFFSGNICGGNVSSIGGGTETSGLIPFGAAPNIQLKLDPRVGWNLKSNSSDMQELKLLFPINKLVLID